MNATVPHITICVCTFRRPEMLSRLLKGIAEQVDQKQFTYSVVIVDNDIEESGRKVAEKAMAESKLPIIYDVEPVRSISLARNRSVQNARGDLIAFIDDDEFPAPDWLSKHLQTLYATSADGVLGPVEPYFDGEAPRWLTRSGLLQRKRFKTGDALTNYSDTRTGNVLLWKRLFDVDKGSFDPKYGRSGGGDAVFFKSMLEKGKTFVWCDEACVYETVPPERQKRMYYVRRALTRGLTESWVTRFFSFGTIRSLVALTLYTLALPLLFLMGQHLFMKYLVKTCDHLSKVLGYFGIRLVAQRPY
jgi:succinoglycan biosynthesis protein ExoM